MIAVDDRLARGKVGAPSWRLRKPARRSTASERPPDEHQLGVLAVEWAPASGGGGWIQARALIGGSTSTSKDCSATG